MTFENQEIENFLTAINEAFSGMDTRTSWPLNGGQITAYFNVDEALDIYYRLNKLKKEISLEKIAGLMPAPDIIRIFLQNSAIFGLKVADKLAIKKINIRDRVNFTLFLFDILKQKVKNDIFCLDGKNLLLDDNQVKKTLSETKWNAPLSNQEKKDIAFLTITANNLCYTLFYDIYMTGGFYIHGPYDASKQFGENTILVIRNYHDLNPVKIWPDLKMPYQKIKIYAIYNNLDFELNFANQPISTTSVGDKLIAYKIYLDNKEITLNQINQLTELFSRIASKQTKETNSLSDLDKVRKGSEIAFYLFKKIREYMGDKWYPSEAKEQIEETIKKFGDKFIKEFKYQEKPSLEHWKKSYDPRNNYF